MNGRFYKLALRYIGKCNAKWENRHKEKLKELERLTYKNFGKYMLFYGADAEWQNFSRYDVLDNAIQRLAQYEDGEKEIRNKAIDEFKEKILRCDVIDKSIIRRLAEQLKGGAK